MATEVSVTVLDTPTLIVSAGGSGARSKSVAIQIDPLLAIGIDLGGDQVVSGQGYALEPGEGLTFVLCGTDTIYGVAPAGQSVVVQVLSLP